MKLRLLAALAVAAAAAAVPAATFALMLWTLVGSPLTATANQSTTFTLTATNLDVLTELGCLEVDLPASFVIESLGTPTASNGDTWASSKSGNAVIVHSLSGGGRLEITEWVKFTIKAHATVAGAFTWPNHAHRQQDCSTADQIGVPLAVTVLPALFPTASPTPTATPAPTASPTPTATPTHAPTATPTPILPLPSIDLGLPTPSALPLPTSSPAASPTVRPTPTPAAGSAVVPEDPPRDGSASGSTALALHIAHTATAEGGDADVGVELLGLLDFDYVWFVPAASVALPGLLVIVWVLLQAIGALAWIPAVRRMADEERTPAHRPGGARA